MRINIGPFKFSATGYDKSGVALLFMVFFALSAAIIAGFGFLIVWIASWFEFHLAWWQGAIIAYVLMSLFERD